MAELKTKKNNASVTAFLDTIEDGQKREDSYALLKIFATLYLLDLFIFYNIMSFLHVVIIFI